MIDQRRSSLGSRITPPARVTFSIRMRRFVRAWDPGKNLALLILAVLALYPFFLMLILSVKDIQQFTLNEFGISWPFHIDNYTSQWSQLWPYMWNSIVVTVVSVAGILVLSSLGGFVFARYNFPAKSFLWYGILSLMMIPFILTLIPLFLEIENFGLLDTRWALILPYISGGQVFGMLLLRSFFASLPEEMFEAARIDGAGEMTALVRLAVPLSLPILSTLAILNILSIWNDIIWPAVALSNADDLKTLPLGLQIINQSESYGLTNYGPMMAAYTMASLPLLILFVFTSRLFVKGLSSGAIKL